MSSILLLLPISYFAGQAPVASLTEVTSSSRSCRSLLVASTPLGGGPAVAPPVGFPDADVSAGLQPAGDLDTLADELRRLTFARAGQLIGRGGRAAGADRSAASRSGSSADAFDKMNSLPAPTPVPAAPPLPASCA